MPKTQANNNTSQKLIYNNSSMEVLCTVVISSKYNKQVVLQSPQQK